MWYAIFAIAIIWILFKPKKNKKPKLNISVSMHVENSGWEEEKEKKAQALKKLKKEFEESDSIQSAIIAMERAVNNFITNHGRSVDEIIDAFNEIDLPDDEKKCELALRKELNKHYKNRSNVGSKLLSIYISSQHVKLQLQNPETAWKIFSGLQRLQSNLKAEEYFDALLKLMFIFKRTFNELPISEKLSKDIERTFELWNSRNLAKKTYEENCIAFENVEGASDRHFIILGIVEYLDRRNKFNPRYRNELIEWCEKDIDLYEQFLISFHEYELFTSDERFEFFDNPSLKQKKLAKIKLADVKKLKDYFVPRLTSFDVLEVIYEQEQDVEKLAWLGNIGVRIGYVNQSKVKQLKPPNLEHIKPEKAERGMELSQITKTIEVSKSGQKGKLAFLNSSGGACSTEDVFKDYMEQLGWSVMRAEVSFWQAMFCLSFWDEIFDGMGNPIQGQDIPIDLFRSEEFYLNRKASIDQKFEKILKQNLQNFINTQIHKNRNYWTRLIYNGNQDMITYFETPIVQSFLGKISPKIFAKTVYRIAQNPNDNRAGVSDFVIWNDKELKMIEVKKLREQVRESQKAWIAWMLDEGIPNEIIRVKGV